MGRSPQTSPRVDVPSVASVKDVEDDALDMLEAIAVAEDASVEVVTSPHPPAIKKCK